MPGRIGAKRARHGTGVLTGQGEGADEAGDHPARGRTALHVFALPLNPAQPGRKGRITVRKMLS